jgi:small subunit ribosomal protein S3
MWHKVSPQAFRIPYIKNWSATWFADKKTYALELWVDNNIRATLKKSFKDIPTWDIVISRSDKDVLVSIYTAKSSLVLWKDWENVTSLEASLSKQVNAKVKLSVKEVKNPDLNAKIVWFMITNQIEKRMPYKRAIKQAISKTIEKWAKWIKVKVGWRLNGAEIARKETFKEGNIPTQTVRADIDYTTARAETVYWTIWIKVRIYKWDIFKRK